jgi:hypothetical protein
VLFAHGLRRSPRARLRTFWSKPDQSLWLACVDDAYERSFSFNLVTQF